MLRPNKIYIGTFVLLYHNRNIKVTQLIVMLHNNAAVSKGKHALFVALIMKFKNIIAHNRLPTSGRGL